MFFLEILKNLFAKDFIKFIFDKSSGIHKLIKTYGKTLLSLIILILMVLLVSHITTFLKGGIWNSSTKQLEILKAQNEKAVKRLFHNCKEKNKECKDHFMISFIFLECKSDDSVRFRWLDMQGFSEGNIIDFKKIYQKQNAIFNPTKTHDANRNDNCQDILNQKETNKLYRHDERGSTSYLETHKAWIDEELTNYSIRNIYYYIQPFVHKKGFIMLQVSTVRSYSKFLDQRVYDGVFEDLKENLKRQVKKNNFKINNDSFYN